MDKVRVTEGHIAIIDLGQCSEIELDFIKGMLLQVDAEYAEKLRLARLEPDYREWNPNDI
jgi:hypothetical protein